MGMNMDTDDVVIDVENISKVYQIWNEPSARLKAPLLEAVSQSSLVRTKFRQKLRDKANSYRTEFPALSDISFKVTRGESVGILGVNGAGKSTLLQILTGVLKPTQGNFHVSGTVAALLELGSSFNPLFTGRENVYLNASILGLSDKEIGEVMSDILDFADIGDFVDRPVRTYSSGMKLRLAFAVQIMVEPEVLIVDEALAVGDVFFQAKCMHRLQQLKENGTTILFVSHSTGAVKELCSRALLLDQGKLVSDGLPINVVQRYLAITAEKNALPQSLAGESEIAETTPPQMAKEKLPEFVSGEPGEQPADIPIDNVTLGKESFDKLAEIERFGNRKALVMNAQLLDLSGKLVDKANFGEQLLYRVWIRAFSTSDDLMAAYHIRTKNGTDIAYSNLSLSNIDNYSFESGHDYVIDWNLPLKIRHGKYFMGVHLSRPIVSEDGSKEWEFVDMINFAYAFSVAPRPEGMIGGPVAFTQGARIRDVVVPS